MKHWSVIVLYGCVAFFLSGCGSRTGQKIVNHMPESEIKTDTAISYAFPEDWTGEWTGLLQIYDHRGMTQSLEMGLVVEKTDTQDTYDWIITYGSDSTAQRRAYQLMAVDTSKGHFMIDEKNGIFLDGYHMHDAFVSIFDVMGNTLLISYERKKENLVYTVDVFPSREVRVSGDTLINGQEIPQVKSFQYKGKQRAVLNKKCLVE